MCISACGKQKQNGRHTNSAVKWTRTEIEHLKKWILIFLRTVDEFWWSHQKILQQIVTKTVRKVIIFESPSYFFERLRADKVCNLLHILVAQVAYVVFIIFSHYGISITQQLQCSRCAHGTIFVIVLNRCSLFHYKLCKNRSSTHYFD
jgi:hypothetical protein